MGGEFYTPVNAVEWCAELRKVSGWMQEKIYAYDRERQGVEVPSGDSVDVLPNPIGQRIAAEADSIVKSRGG